jgi:hypothetical protein
LPRVAAHICFLRTAETRTRLISPLRRSTIRRRFRHKKRSFWKINCRGWSSMNQSRRFRQSRRRSLTTNGPGFLDRWSARSDGRWPDPPKNRPKTSGYRSHPRPTRWGQRVPPKATWSKSETIATTKASLLFVRFVLPLAAANLPDLGRRRLVLVFEILGSLLAGATCLT